MNILATFNDNATEPTGYIDRETVKAVILNANDEVLLFQGVLPGGGVELGETNEEALARELMEEIGATVTINRELGNVIAYRDLLQRCYVFTGYECSLDSLGTPTTTIDTEVGRPAVWEKRMDAIARMEAYVQDVITKGKEIYEGDRYQKHLHVYGAAIVFLKAVGK